MGGTATGSMACVRTMLLLVAISARLLASPAASRQPPLESESAAAPGDGSKITLVFCILGECNYFGHGWQGCYCCGGQYRKQSCHPTLEECRAHCPLRNPTCSPAPPTLAATTNAASYN
ncbi:hypothetical protein GQ55_9G381600 [Panicum hallii var. hallii]|uniref:Embryo surrounding factor 1 brassicaceae domain-containing protein n=1 Tax=Panicum hallii var. hallii TaxID=1504633 RepID=A0A2T7C987_9POAL|nr:hypothetical protein GQ55_9G381600 [Panicum hallii var. hallii]